MPGVVVLMHVLGDKHSPPVDLRAVLCAARASRDPAREFVLRASTAAPALTTRLDEDQLRYLEQVASPLYEQVLAGRLPVVVSVRAPHAWVRAALVWQRRIRPATARWDADAVATLCDRHNVRVASWLALQDDGRDVAVVRHEELQGDHRAVVERVARELGLPSPAAGRIRLSMTRGGADWDQAGHPWLSETERGRALRLATTPPLGDALTAVVDERIDWDLAARLGYGRPPAERRRALVG